MRIAGCWLAMMLCGAIASAAPFIVENGQPKAQIVTAEDAPTMVTLAARELQTYLAKISGAELPIATEPDAAFPVKIYVGASSYTESLGVTADGLHDGAYRLKSGEDWLVLIGRDWDFAPVGIWAKNRKQWLQEGQAEWDAATQAAWENPLGNEYPAYNRELDLWRHDETGTLNAVYGILRRLGVRWYMPGELGEVVPRQSSIELPAIFEKVEPDFPLRMVNFARYPVAPLDDIMWSLRLGVNDPFGYHTHHGLSWITDREETKAAHPEFYALYNGMRDINSGTSNACLSSEALFQEHLRFLRFMFDMYDAPILSVWPADGFTQICQCPDCVGQETPERGSEGRFSDYVWGYVNRLALELAKTHPDKKISCGAYSTYRLPPTRIDKLPPNVVVQLVNGRRRWTVSEPEFEELHKLQQAWAEKSANKLILFMNFWYANTPHLIADDIRHLKPVSMGEDLWVPEHRGFAQPGWNHLNTYVTTRYWWDAHQDVDMLLEEYYRLFYGPAAAEMKAFIDYYEQHSHDMGPVGSAPLIQQALALFEQATAKAPPDSVYGQRLALFSEGLNGLRQRYQQIAKGRVNVPEQRLYGETGLELAELKIDGKLDDAYWKASGGAAHLPGRLVEQLTGAKPRHETRFKIGTDKRSLFVGISCQDEPGNTAYVTATEHDDPAIWQGDVVEILLETAGHSNYQIGINPAGAIVDLDRQAEEGDWFKWDSQAEVATYVDKEKGYWSAELRIPFTSSTNDPLHEVIGTLPVENLPWFFNICRQRVRGDETERSSFSPSENGCHDILKFARLSKR